MEGWRSVGELTRWGFAHAPVVMANEAHDRLTRSVRAREPGIPELLAELGDILAAHGGTAGILREQAPPPLDTHTGVDAVVASTDNTLT